MSENIAVAPKKRSLIMAGGGLKVAFQAGVLQVWLDEYGLEFDHADGASGGTFNLAMYCQGMSGTQIADNWRNIPISHGVQFNWTQYFKLIYAPSILKMDKWKKNVFTAWGLDWELIRSSPKVATFSVYNFTQHQLKVLAPSQMTPDYLVACGSLPMWFPPVTIEDELYIDAVYLTDANLMEAVRRGADELWIIWTVSERSVWDDGFLATYFQVIETTANGHFRQDLQRIDANNAAIAAGQSGEFGRSIDVKILRAEVPLHYILNLSSDRFKEATNRGVEHARAWCQAQGLTPKDVQLAATTISNPSSNTISAVSFTEEMKGYITLGVADYQQGFQDTDRAYLMVHLTIEAEDIEKFVADPQHDAKIEGYIDCAALGGKLIVESGRFNLFVDEGDPTHKKMIYSIYFQDSTGQPLTLWGFKDVKDDLGFDVWNDTSTLYTQIYRGHVSQSTVSPEQIIAAGIINIYLLDFIKQLTTFRATGTNNQEKLAALTRFGIFFLGKLWDVYGNQILLYGPY